MMKLAEMRALSETDLVEQINTLQKQLFEARMQHGLRQLDNTAQLRNLKHQIAQLHTVLAQLKHKVS